MLKSINPVVRLGGAILIIFLTQVAADYLLPYPFNRINVVLLSLLWLIIYRNNLNYIWFIPAISLITDLFSSQPYGLTALALLSSILITRKIFEIFSIFSWYSVFILALLGMFFYKFFLYMLLLIISFFYKRAEVVLLPNFTFLLLEFAVNAFAILFAYLIAKIFWRKKIIYQSIF